MSNKNLKLLVVPMVGGRGIGPICRTLAVANFAKQFFDIKFFCSKKFAPFVEKEGYDYVLDVEPTQVFSQGDFIKWNDAAYAMGLCDEFFVKRAFSHQLKIVKEYNPDVIFTEYNLTICLVAKILNIPIVSTVHWADTSLFAIGNTQIPNKFNNAITTYNSILREYGLETYSDISSMVTDIPKLVAPTIEKLQPKLKIFNVDYVGELLNKKWETDVEVERDLPDNIIYIYLVTSDLTINKWFNVVLREFSDTNYQIYLVLNNQLEYYIANNKIIVPKNFHISYFYPSLSVLKKAKLVIHAGSANIISGSLINGVPSLLIPLFDGERLYNSIGVEKLGAGEIITENDFLREGSLFLRSTKLINSTHYNKRASELGAEIKLLGGVSKVCEILLKLAKKEDGNEKIKD